MLCVREIAGLGTCILSAQVLEPPFLKRVETIESCAPIRNSIADMKCRPSSKRANLKENARARKPRQVP